MLNQKRGDKENPSKPKEPKKERLQKIIAQATELSRRAAEKVIAEGLVSVNGHVVTKLGTCIDPYSDAVFYKGRRLLTHQPKIYLAFNKPRNYMVTKSDPEDRPTIWDCLDKWKDKVNSAGRLDFDSQGLMILTNDGQLLNRLTHPSKEIDKNYNVKVKGRPSEEALDILRNGVKLEDGITRPATVVVNKEESINTWLNIRIHEGKNRQVRRMCQAIGHPVLRLKRTSIGPVKLGQLQSGKCRHLTELEVSTLRGVNKPQPPRPFNRNRRPRRY